MDYESARPLDCGHVAPPKGVCQHDGCGNQMCNECIASCAESHNTLCPNHQKRLSDGAIVCPDHVAKHVSGRLASKATKTATRAAGKAAKHALRKVF